MGGKKGEPGRHTWRFFRAGGFDQVKLETGEDLVALGKGELDQKLWVALACPAKDLEFDSRTLALVDADGDGRIRAPEVIEAVRWACGLLKDPVELYAESSELPLISIATGTPEGEQILASARQILTSQGKEDSEAISVAATETATETFAQTKFNGDGVVPADSASDEGVAAAIADIVSCVGGVPDRSGKPGVDQATADRFFEEAQAYSDWLATADKDEAIRPLGDATESAHAALSAVRAKVDDYFARTRAAAYDPRALTALNREESEYLGIAANDLTATAEELAGFPLAQVEAGKPLPLAARLNPAWAGAIAKLAAEVVTPLLGERESLTEEEWSGLKATFSAFEAWTASKAGAAVEGLGAERVAELISGDSRSKIGALIAKDLSLEGEANAIADVEKLVRFHRDLVKLLVNFVSFKDFYARDMATFQAGTLYVDQKTCDLCVRVTDPAKHAALAGMAKTYLAYCDCTRPSTGEKMTIAAAVTGGDPDNLMVGRNGVFYDRNGRDWDATITKIIENPISIRQAFWSPYKRFVRAIEEQVAKRAAAAEAASSAKMDTAAASVATADKSTPAAEPKKMDVGTVAALGVAVGAIGTALATLATGFASAAVWQIPVIILGAMLIISTPSMIIAALKLRQRNLGPILDASGWAVNARAKINIPFGGSLTKIASLPQGSQRDLRDPYKPPKSLARRLFGWLVILAVLAGIAFALWRYGVVERVLPGRFPKSSWYLERHPEMPAGEEGAPESPGD